jgi:hypothetical protein
MGACFGSHQRFNLRKHQGCHPGIGGFRNLRQAIYEQIKTYAIDIFDLGRKLLDMPLI